MSATGSGDVRSGTVDTTAPFESVKEAVHRFEATWRPQPPPILLRPEEIELMKVEEQTVKLEMDLFVKERETLKVLKELEMTKRIADDLKLQLQKLTSESPSATKVHPIPNTEEERPVNSNKHFEVFPRNTGGKQSPGKTLMGLEQAKANLSRTTSGLSGVRTTIESLKMKIEKEKSLRAKTDERLHLNRATAASLEQMLGRYIAELRLKSGPKTISTQSASEVWARIRQLNSEKENYVRTMENHKSDICNLTAEIEQTKSRIKTAEVRLILAKKMKEASKVAEAIALREIRSLREKSETDPSEVTLPVKDYATLTLRAREADEISKKIVGAATLEVERAKQSKLELVEKVEGVEAEVSTGRKALEEALKREEAANEVKLEAEEALRRMRSELGQQRRSVHSSTKFKNSAGTQRRGGSQMLDVNGLSLATSGPLTVLGSTLSIGQILRKKLMAPEEHKVRMSAKGNGKPRVSLAQILAQKHELYSPPRIDDGSARKHFFARRRKFSFAGLALLLAKQKRRKRKHDLNS
ncbi:WEB family protein At2g38370-like [Ananas comosus]|uniref:WEB family protein At2g38370-like n=1 Tax=Ananas comosus TaxID=4615 RepID=A0A6P5G1F8_ANACO|nr:WEB family protein At2g38370-like [Ananas comosus]